jgi:hypothetical protein
MRNNIGLSFKQMQCTLPGAHTVSRAVISVHDVAVIHTHKRNREMREGIPFPQSLGSQWWFGREKKNQRREGHPVSQSEVTMPAPWFSRVSRVPVIVLQCHDPFQDQS